MERIHKVADRNVEDIAVKIANRIVNEMEGMRKVRTLESYITNIPDYPEPGTIFRDVTSVVQNPDGLKLSIHEMLKQLEGTEFDVVAGAESRGFLFGMPIAYIKQKGFVMIRKQGKLPRETVSQDYNLEYGSATIEMHKDSIFPGQRVVLVDDVLATGGTAEAGIKLIESLGGKVVKVLVLIELAGLEGRKKLEGYDVAAALTYPGK